MIAILNRAGLIIILYICVEKQNELYTMSQTLFLTIPTPEDKLVVVVLPLVVILLLLLIVQVDALLLSSLL